DGDRTRPLRRDARKESRMPAADAPPLSSDLLLRDEGAVRWLSINRPASQNGLTVPVNQALIAALDAAGASQAVRVVVLTGEGGSFCSGLDLKFAAEAAGALDDVAGTMDRWFHGLIRAVRRLEKPVIAFVDGAAVGFGC